MGTDPVSKESGSVPGVAVWQVETGSDEETRSVGRHLADILPKKAVVLLTGDLGAGKTTITKGIAAGRGAASPNEVSSPTYTLIHEYGQPARIYHVDLYRLDSLQEAARLGLEELFEREALVLVEWGERFPELFPDNAWQIRLTQLPESDGRLIELFGPVATPLARPAPKR